jgi:hypothetical protein
VLFFLRMITIRSDNGSDVQRAIAIGGDNGRHMAAAVTVRSNNDSDDPKAITSVMQQSPRNGEGAGKKHRDKNCQR